jgi:uncharacterized protein (DUF305 family)
MHTFRPLLRPSAALAVALLAACGAAAAPPAAVPSPVTPPTAASVRVAHAPEDVLFMQHMVVHHAQAVEMTELVGDRTQNSGIRLLAERIAVSQDDEMARMRQWLAARGEAAPDEHAHHHGDHAGMPGMATPAQMAQLRAARGAEFDRLFLERMIHHHEGALVMVEELFASERGGQEPAAFHFASEVDADQRMEIERMRRMQDALRAGAPQR